MKFWFYIFLYLYIYRYLLITGLKEAAIDSSESEQYKTNIFDSSWAEQFIKCVEDRPPLYNVQLCLTERTNLKKNALWSEILNTIGGNSIEELKAKWKYFKDRYMKAKKKVNTYKPSGSAFIPVNPGFQYYNLMKFLDDSSEPQP